MIFISFFECELRARQTIRSDGKYTFLHLEKLQSYRERISILLIDGPRWPGNREHLPVVVLLFDRQYYGCGDERPYQRHYHPSRAPFAVL